MSAKMTPVLVPDGLFHAETVIEMLKNEITNLDSNITEYYRICHL